MLNIAHRTLYRSNGLIDDFVVSGKPQDYVSFAHAVNSATSSPTPVIVETDSFIRIAISVEGEFDELFTSFQNEDNQYYSHKDWEERDVLRVMGAELVLQKLYEFLKDLSGRGQGYSYLSEYSKTHHYSPDSPQWRLHVDNTLQT